MAGFSNSGEIARLAMPTFHNHPSAPTNLTRRFGPIGIDLMIGCGDAPESPGDMIHTSFFF